MNRYSDAYQVQARVRYSEVDERAQLTIENVLEYFQDASIFEAEDGNVGVSFQKERNMAWILLTWQIEVERYPMLGEKIVIKTFPYGFRASMGYRNFIMEDEQGNRLAWADSLWMLVSGDLTSGVSLPEEMIAAYTVRDKLDMEYRKKKVVLPANAHQEPIFSIERHHLDTNQHVNNGQYVRMMSYYLPKDRTIKGMKVEYRNQAFLGDTVIPMIGDTDSGCVVSLQNAEGKPYAVGSFY